MDPHSRYEREQRANKIVLGAIVGLLALVLVAVASLAFERPGAQKSTRPQPTSAPTRTPQQPASAPATAPVSTPTTTDTLKQLSAEAATKKAAPVPKPKPPRKRTTPERMAKIPSGAKQIVVITGKKLGSNTGRLALYNKKGSRWVEAMNVEANFGKNGLVDGTKRRTGNLETPTGIWRMGSFVFGLHSKAPSGTKMRYKAITSRSHWSSAHDSTHNTWVEGDAPGERLADADPQYEFAFNTGYNSPPNRVVYGRGTAIFVHCFEPPGNSLGKFTHGCIAIDRKNMIRLFRMLDEDKNPVCAIGTLKRGSSTSIWAY
ncbi:MAG: L,D-transpeptidase family protein [Coriobacteriales bacterium]|nr:L,D-transpeptidase family protein [Coriobacteriales bacterium]